MSAKKGRGVKVAADKTRKALPFAEESPNQDSFLQGLQQNHGNCLHSTAVEEGLNVSETQTDRGNDPRVKTAHRGTARKRKNPETNEKEAKKKGGKGTGQNVGSHKGVGRNQKKGKPGSETAVPATSHQPEAKGGRGLAGKTSTKRTIGGTSKAVRPQKKKRESETDDEPQDGSDTDVSQQSRRTLPTSDEDADADASWNPSPKKAKMKGFGRSRKSLSESKSKSRKSSSDGELAEAVKPNTKNQPSKKPFDRPGTDLEVALDAFLDFCDQYKESVESAAVKQSINSFSSNVKEQLLEKITLQKEVKGLKRENAKVGSLIRSKSQRLFDAKDELMRAERQVVQLQKEKSQLELRLADLRRSHGFLRDLGELNRHYLDHRRQHRDEKETYGASSLAALLLEARHVQTTEGQLKRINDQMEERLNKNETCK